MQLIFARSFIGLLFLCLLAPSFAKENIHLGKIPELSPGFLIGYLPKEALPNSLLLLPAPPGEQSMAFALDQHLARHSQTLRESERWQLAILDADLTFPSAAGTFSCALQAPISEEHTPHLYVLLRRTLADAGLATYTAKKHYARTRPFVLNQQPSCTPDHEAKLADDGSYPSGHSAIGWAWALVLSELAPERSDALLARGRAYSESRLVCNVHWYSDIREGRDIGAAAVARLHGDPAFQSDFAAARWELMAVRAKQLAASRDCVAEAAALSKSPLYD